MKKKPETIADLKINWTFEKEIPDVISNRLLFDQLNPDLKSLKLKSGVVILLYKDKEITCCPWPSELLSHYIDFMSYVFSVDVGKKVKLSHFEKISKTEYRIHGKEL